MATDPMAETNHKTDSVEIHKDLRFWAEDHGKTFVFANDSGELRLSKEAAYKLVEFSTVIMMAAIASNR